MGKIRGIFEGPEWAESCAKVWAFGATALDDAFRFAQWNLAVASRTNSHPFLGVDERVMVIQLPNIVEAWIFFRIEADDNNVTLLWMEGRGVRVG